MLSLGCCWFTNASQLIGWEHQVCTNEMNDWEARLKSDL